MTFFRHSKMKIRTRWKKPWFALQQWMASSRAMNPLILGAETWCSNGSYYYMLIYELQPSEHDSKASATDSYCDQSRFNF